VNSLHLKNIKGNTNIRLLFIQIIIISMLLKISNANTIYATMTATNTSVGATSNYSISFNRNLNNLGQTITPSSLSSTYIITLAFDSTYNINSSILISGLSNYTVNTSTQTVFINLNQTVSNLTIVQNVNPLPSQVALKVTISLYNSSNTGVAIDTGIASLTFQSVSFSSSGMSYSFFPGNVSTLSNLTLGITPFAWNSSNLVLKLSFLTYWTRNMLNVSSNNVLSSMSYCSPACTINNMGSFFSVAVSNLNLTGNSLILKIFNILSPATL